MKNVIGYLLIYCIVDIITSSLPEIIMEVLEKISSGLWTFYIYYASFIVHHLKV